MLTIIRTSVTVLALFTVLTGALYPLLVTGIAQVLFPLQAGGSIIMRDGMPAGSALVGQHFEGPGYFRGRPSATRPHPYNAASSSASNLSQGNPALIKRVQESASLLKAAHRDGNRQIPADLVTSSGSGLDPHISPAAAGYQIRRVAEERGLDEAVVRSVVDRHTEERQFGILGEPRVNVLKLNLSLDELR